MKKIRDPETGAIKYVPDINDVSRSKLINKVNELEKRIKRLENLIKEQQNASIIQMENREK